MKCLWAFATKCKLLDTRGHQAPFSFIVPSTGREVHHLLQNHEHPRLRHDQLHPTQGQWWSDSRNACTERRVKLVASCMGFWLWTADFRNAQSGKRITSKFFCTKPSSEEPVALFEDAEDRQRWMEDQWQKRAV